MHISLIKTLTLDSNNSIEIRFNNIIRIIVVFNLKAWGGGRIISVIRFLIFVSDLFFSGVFLYLKEENLCMNEAE